MGLPADAILEPATERLQIRLAPRPVTLRQHTRRLGSDAESREQPDTLQKLDLVHGGGMVPTAYGVRGARAAQAAGVASKLTISLRPRGTPFGAAGEDGSASAAERHAADTAGAEGGKAEATGTKKKKKKGRRKKNARPEAQRCEDRLRMQRAAASRPGAQHLRPPSALVSPVHWFCLYTGFRFGDWRSISIR
eukprot:scaffold14485_cov67-Phaeocystis_antarctica.AAC.1